MNESRFRPCHHCNDCGTIECGESFQNFDLTGLCDEDARGDETRQWRLFARFVDDEDQADASIEQWGNLEHIEVAPIEEHDERRRDLPLARGPLIERIPIEVQ